MKNIISFSGGKDSTALICWAIENLEYFEVVFADTGWEHPLTYWYINYINEKLCHGNLVIVRSQKYSGFEEMSIQRKRVPSTKARFCTQELKLFPIHNYIHSKFTKEELKELTMHDGRRAEESISRSKLKEIEFDLNYYGCWVRRPLLKWTKNDILEIVKRHDIELNPLYNLGMKRVGCMPCIMSSLPEIKIIAEKFPDVIDKVRNLEEKLGRTFFPPDRIPARFCSRRDEKGNPFPTIDDVVNYVRDNPNQLLLFNQEPESCMSGYSVCE
jgi:3'-phosphoadenosine 5'-phosphosulfate sulfotransferase (PAPS reductase)/FAD synthetase